MFKVGDKVKCIDISGTSGRYLELNKIYTVKHMEGCNPGHLITIVGMDREFYRKRFELLGIRNPNNGIILKG